MSKIKKINISEVEGSQYSVFPVGTIWVDLQNRLRISDGVTQGGISLIGNIGGGSTYSNSNVAAYLPTYTGNIQLGNITNGDYTWSFGADGNVSLASNLTIVPTGNFAPVYGTAILQNPSEYFMLSSMGAYGTTLVGWGENVFGPGNVAIATFNENNLNDVRISTGNYLSTVYTWAFSADGNLTIPGNINSTAGTGNVVINASDGTTTSTWTFSENGSTTLPGNSSVLSPEGAFLTHRNFNGNVYTQQNQDTSTWELYSEDDNTGSYGAWAWIKESLYTVDTPEVFIENQKGSDGIPHRWTFGSDGELTFPDTTVQTTAYSNAAVAAYLIENPQGSTYSNSNVASYMQVVDFNIVPDLTNFRTLGSINNKWDDIFTHDISPYGNINPLTTGQTLGSPYARWEKLWVVDGDFFGNINLGGNINIEQSNINVITFTGNSGSFFGNAGTGFSAIYVGLPEGYVTLPYTIAQFSDNSDSYAQINHQNLSQGQNATTDYVATADNGTDTTYYIDLGIAGSHYDGSSPTNSLGTLLYSNDSYLYAQGNLESTVGGNLIIGTSTLNRRTSFFAGPSDIADEIARVDTNGFTAKDYFWANGQRLSSTITGTYGDTNVAAYLLANPQSTSSYGDSNVAAYLATHPQYSNSNVASYLTAVNYYSNANVAAYLIANPQTGTYSNTNVAAYLLANPQGSTYSDSNVAAYLIANPPTGTYGDGNVETYLATHPQFSNADTVAYLSSTAIPTLSTTGNLVVGGNLIINGNATTISTNNLIIDDNIIYFANANPANSLDIGIAGHFVAGTYQHTGFVRQASSNTWMLFSNIVAEPTNTIDFTNAVYDPIRTGNITSPTITDIYSNLGTLVSNAGSQQSSITNIYSNLATQTTNAASQQTTINSLSATINGNVNNANVAYYTNVATTSTNATFYPALYNTTTGNAFSYVNTGLTYNPSLGNLYTSGDVVATGNVFAQGGYFRTGASTVYVANVTPTTAYAFGNATNTYIGASNANVIVNGYSLGYLDIPQNAQNSNYVIAYGDRGKHIYSTASGSQTIYIPTNANAGLPVGSAINIVLNGTGNVTISANSGVTMYLAGNSTSTSTRTLSSFGMATLQKVATNTWFVVGVGLT